MNERPLKVHSHPNYSLFFALELETSAASICFSFLSLWHRSLPTKLVFAVWWMVLNYLIDKKVSKTNK